MAARSWIIEAALLSKLIRLQAQTLAGEAHVTCIHIHLDFIHQSDPAGFAPNILAVFFKILRYMLMPSSDLSICEEPRIRSLRSRRVDGATSMRTSRMSLRMALRMASALTAHSVEDCMWTSPKTARHCVLSTQVGQEVGPSIVSSVL